MNKAFTSTCSFKNGAKDQKNQQAIGYKARCAPENAIEGISDDLHEIANVDTKMRQQGW